MIKSLVSRCPRWLPALVLASSALLIPAIGYTNDVATAEALFREGRDLMDRGDFEKACDKFAASQRLDPSSGTLINLASCHAAQGKTASAWAEFVQASNMARAQGNASRADEAGKRASDLEKSLAYLTITVPPAVKVPGLQVKRDTSTITEESYGSKLPTDPGNYIIAASAPGYISSATKVSIKAGESQSVTLQPLVKEPPKPIQSSSVALSAMPPAPPPEPPSYAGVYTSYGFGVAGLLIGGILGGVTLSTYSNAKNECPTLTGCSSDAIQKHNTAVQLAWGSDIGFGVGIAGAVVGTILLLTTPSGSPPAQQGFMLTPNMGPHGWSMDLSGHF